MLTRLHKKNLGSKGVTLVELLVVIAILGILGAVALPAITGTLPNYRLRAEARELVSNFKKARLEAVKRNRNVLIEFYPNENRYLIYVDMNYTNDYEQNEDKSLMNWTLRQQTEIVDPSFNLFGNSEPITGFDSRGMPLGSNINSNFGTGSVILRTVNGSRGYQLFLSSAGSINLDDE